jgi:hypothetical protein
MYNNMMHYFFLYLLFGFIFMLCIIARAYFKGCLEFFSKNNILKDILIYLLCILIWPIIVVMVLYSFYEDWRYAKFDKKQEIFELQPTDLIEKVERQEVELREVVYDPLNAAPQIPFGHLNSVWLEFCEQLEIQDELWSFDLIWRSKFGYAERYAGYASVRNKCLNKIFYTL